MSASFNLLDNPFIPCVRDDGRATEVDIRTALREARTIKRVAAESPLVTIGLHRVLLAVLHAALRGPGSLKKWSEFWRSKEWPADQLCKYFTENQNRFDLFHPQYPFFQRAGFTEGKRVGANKLAAEITETNVKLMFSHVSDDEPPVFCYPEIARQLIAHQLTTGQGGRGYGASPLSRGAIILAEGDNLFETLQLNLIRYKINENDPVLNLESDAPAWETNTNPCVASNTPDGLLDLYTWQSRSVLLLPEPGGGGVRWMHYGPGRMFRSEATVYDPAVAFRETKDQEVRAVGFDEHRAIWRDSGAILEFGSENRHRRPPWAEQFCKVGRDEPDLKGTVCRVVVLGALTDSAKVKFWRHESLPLPPAYLDNPELVEQLKLALRLAESVDEALRSASWTTAAARLTGDSGVKPDAKRVRNLVESFAPDRVHWSRLERPYRELVVALAEPSADRPRLVARWFHDTLAATARHAFQTTIGRVEGGRNYKAAAVGERALDSLLVKVQRAEQIPDRNPQDGAA